MTFDLVWADALVVLRMVGAMIWSCALAACRRFPTTIRRSNIPCNMARVTPILCAVSWSVTASRGRGGTRPYYGVEGYHQDEEEHFLM